MTMKLTKLLLLLVAAASTLLSSDSSVVAATATANLGVSTSVTANCSIAVTNNVVFAAYDPVGANAAADDDATGTLSVTCTKGAGVSIALDLGANSSSGAPRMKGPGAADFLAYMLYSDSGRSTPWSNATYTISPATTKAARTFTVYGRIARGQDVSVGAYSDTVVATLTF
jgi:spore coat protein U-like protein